MKIKDHCKDCTHRSTRYDKPLKYGDWCCAHSNFSRKVKSICMLKGTKNLKKDKNE